MRREAELWTVLAGDCMSGTLAQCLGKLFSTSVFLLGLAFKPGTNRSWTQPPSMDHCPLYQGKLHFPSGFLWEVAVTQNLEPPSASYTRCCSVVWREYTWCIPSSALSPPSPLNFIPPLGSGVTVCKLSSSHFLFRVLLLSQGHCRLALLLSFIMHRTKASWFSGCEWYSSTLSVSLHISYFQFPNTWVILMRTLGNVSRWWGLLTSLSYSELSWFVHPSIYLTVRQSQILINLDQVSSSCYFLLTQLTWSHAPFPTLGTLPYNSNHVLTCLTMICVLYLHHWPDKRN